MPPIAEPALVRPVAEVCLLRLCLRGKLDLAAVFVELYHLLWSVSYGIAHCVNSDAAALIAAMTRRTAMSSCAAGIRSTAAGWTMSTYSARLPASAWA